MSQTTTTRFRVESPAPHVANLILCNTAKLNSMDMPHFFSEFKQYIQKLDADANIRVILISNDGNTFTSGLDLKSAASIFAPEKTPFPAANSAKLFQTIQDLQESFSAPEKCKKPVIACIDGPCIGGGVDLVTSCDMRYCTKSAYFSIRETKIAIVADLGTLQRISRLVKSKSFIREMVYTGDNFSAQLAHEHGLVNKIFDSKEQMMKDAIEVAKRIASNSPLVVQGSKKVLQFAEEHSVQDGLYQVALWNAAMLKSEDLQEAVVSFMQKRNPTFKNLL